MFVLYFRSTMRCFLAGTVTFLLFGVTVSYPKLPVVMWRG
jgi:hypothetical protein